MPEIEIASIQNIQNDDNSRKHICIQINMEIKKIPETMLMEKHIRALMIEITVKSIKETRWGYF